MDMSLQLSTLHRAQELRRQRLKLQRDADLLEQEEKGLVNDLIQFMVKNDLTDLDNCPLKAEPEPNIVSWPAFLDYIKESGEVDLLEKRPMRSAVKLRWKDGVILPGVESLTKYTLKIA